MIDRYLNELKDFSTCQKVLDSACLGSQSAMDAIIENLVYFNNKYLTFHDEHPKNRDKTIKLFLEEYEHGYNEHSLGVDPHPQLIYMHAISSLSKFYNQKKLKEFFRSYILNMYVPIQNFATIGPYGKYSPLFDNLAPNYLDRFAYARGLNSFIFKTELDKYVQKIYSHHDDREKNQIYCFDQLATFPAKLREYLMEIIVGDINEHKTNYSFISSLDDTYRIFMQLINCKVINKQFTFDAFDTFYPDYKKFDNKTISDEYLKDDNIRPIQEIKKLYLRIIVVREMLSNTNNNDVLSHFGKHFIASSLAILSVLKEFFDYNKITPNIFENKKFDKVFKNDKYVSLLKNNIFPSNLKSHLIHFITFSLDDYSSILEKHPGLDIYVRSYLKPELFEGHNVYLDYDEIDKICDKLR